MDDLLGDFLAETREMLEAIGGELVAWEADPHDRDRLDAIFRFVHTVKGNCGFFDLPRLEALSHAAEDALCEVRAGRRAADARLVSGVLAVIDRIAALTDAIETGDEPAVEGDHALVQALSRPDAAHPEAEVTLRRGTGAAAAVQRTVRLPIGALDAVMSSVSDLVLARNDLARRLRQAEVDPALLGPFERLNAILNEVREAVTRMRMQRIEHLYASLPRLVRDLAAELGKQVRIDLTGGEVELDREMIEMLRDPLTHIIRNAIDHAIEAPADRRAAGKPEIGALTIAARQSGNRIVLRVADDGRGIDGQALADAAVAGGALTAAEAAALDEQERLALIFEPGLSTARTITAVSGRGVGMDVVRANIERVGGSIRVESAAGEGTTIVLSLPLTLTIVPSLTVQAGGQLFAVPRSYVEEIVHGKAGHIEFAQAGEMTLVTVRGQRRACLSLSAVLGSAPPLAPEASTLVLLRLAGGDVFALACDRVLDHEDLVIKPLAPAIMASGIYAGSTLLDDGNPVLMLDVAGIARQARLLGENGARARTLAKEEACEVQRETTPALLFVGCDGRRKAIRLSLVRRIERVPTTAIDLGGDRPRAVIGDAVLALAGAHGSRLDGDHASVLRLGDGEREIAYLIDSIIDTVALPPAIAPLRGDGPVEAVVLIDGRPADLLDAHWLFACHADAIGSADRPFCRLPAGDPWAQSILAPLVASAGYTVVDETFAGTADVAIVPAERAGGDLPAATRITLSADPELCGPDGDRLYRYDRAGLLARLAALRAGEAA